MLLTAARASILIAVAVALSGCGGGAMGPAPPIDKATYVPPQAELMAAGPLGERVLGKASAPVTVIEYVSLTCPHCAQFPEGSLPAHEEGIHRHRQGALYRARVPHRAHRGSRGDRQSLRARTTNISSCSSQFLTRQSEWVSQDVRPDAIYAVAKSSGMSRETFDKCLANQTIIDGLTEVKQRGRQFGVIGTPTFFINGRKAQGEVTFDEIKALIEQAPPPQSS